MVAPLFMPEITYFLSLNMTEKWSKSGVKKETVKLDIVHNFFIDGPD